MSAQRHAQAQGAEATVKGHESYVPPARAEIVDPKLQRPDWTQSGSRDPQLLWLDKNENTDPTLTGVVFRALAEMDPRIVSNYPDCSPLYHTLSEYMGISAHSLVLAPGSDGIIGSVFRAFISPGDLVLQTRPTYAMYPVYARMCGAEVVSLDYESSANGPFLSPSTVTHAIRERKPKLVCMPIPDSPTGTAFDPGALRSIVETALAVGAAVLIDEAYHPFYPHSAVPWISECPNVIVARTFSKAWGLAGLRLGYGVAAPETISLLHKVRPNYEVNMVAVALAVRMITDFEHEMKASVRRLNAGRDYFLSAMRELGLRTYSSEGSFCHVAFDGHAEAVHAALSKVVLYRKDSDAPCLAGFSRFSATTVELIEPVIDCVRRVV